MTTTAEITTAQIRALRSEAAQAGDIEQVALCDLALQGDERGFQACAEAVLDAAAAQSETSLRAITLHGTLSVEDTDGGIWHPSEEARAEIEASDDPEETAVRICETQPSRGAWHC